MITLFNDPFFDTIDKVFETRKVGTSPKSSVKKNDDGYTLLMSIPGLTKDDLKIIVKEGILKISFEKELEDDSVYFVSNFTKSYYLPDNTLESDIKAKVENGILEIKIPFNEKKMIERLISIN